MSDLWVWECAGCDRPVPPMGMCETCGVFGVMRLGQSPSVSLHPGQHEFWTTCRLCGELGMLNIAIITHHERVTITDVRQPDTDPPA